MELFHDHFPEVAEKETRSVTLLGEQNGLPPGEYAFLEFYCVDPECDCRNVMFNVINRKGEHLATLNHCLDADGFKDIGEKQTFLDPLNRQSRYSKALLKLFLTRAIDADYASRLENHHRMMREMVRKRFESHGGHCLRFLKWEIAHPDVVCLAKVVQDAINGAVLRIYDKTGWGWLLKIHCDWIGS